MNALLLFVTSTFSSMTPLLVFWYLLFALVLISSFERRTRREIRNIKEHIRAVEEEIGKIVVPVEEVENVPADQGTPTKMRPSEEAVRDPYPV